MFLSTDDIRDGVEDTRLEAKDTKKSEAKDSPTEDRPSRGEGQKCSRPRTQAQVLSKKKGLHKIFSGDLQKEKVFTKIFQAQSRKKTFSKKFFRRSTNF